MKDNESRNIENLIKTVDLEMADYAKRLSTPDNLYEIKDHSWHYLRKTSPGRLVIRTSHTLESSKETREEARVAKQFLEGANRSRKFSTYQEAALFETKLLKFYSQCGGEVPKIYGSNYKDNEDLGHYWKKGIMIMEDLGENDLRKMFFEHYIREEKNSIYGLFDRALCVLDHLHDIAKNNKFINKTVSDAYHHKLEEKLRRSYRLLVKVWDNGKQHLGEKENEFIEQMQVILESMKKNGSESEQTIIGDVKPEHFIGNKLSFIDFGRSSLGYKEFDIAGILFSDLPIKVDEALECYDNHYKARDKKRHIRLLTSGIFQLLEKAAYIHSLNYFYQSEFENLKKRSPQYVVLASYQERVRDLISRLKDVSTISESKDFCKVESSLNHVLEEVVRGWYTPKATALQESK